ncbi:MAG TPA: 4-hydroxythreonine-4-phosphate dehydrogenase PdxA [Baekduia sp.]|nr:4-hydroxythreonine-4-phosphate dehydrogenase PdxA [Baekduia sp.]
MTRLVVTTGDPSGIGPEVAVRALASWPERGSVVLAGEAQSLDEAVARYAPDRRLNLLPVEGLEPAPMGEVSAAGGAAAMAVLDAGIDLVLDGQADAIVTGPINKAAVREAGHGDFQGHTEYLAQRSGADGRVAMLLDSDRLRVVHVSTHRSLRAATELDPDRLDLVIDLIAVHLRDRGATAPSILVAGLNPHAGEHGAFGTEDDAIILPAIERARGRHPGVRFEGPVAPDTCFLRALDVPETAVVAMYHDQGHIPVKLMARDTAVNVTLGLPFVRTSVDHGTAHDIADRGIADPAPMVAALCAAMALANARGGTTR